MSYTVGHVELAWVTPENALFPGEQEFGNSPNANRAQDLHSSLAQIREFGRVWILQIWPKCHKFEPEFGAELDSNFATMKYPIDHHVAYLIFKSLNPDYCLKHFEKSVEQMWSISSGKATANHIQSDGHGSK